MPQTNIVGLFQAVVGLFDGGRHRSGRTGI
ncbi:MAG: hypothetical protein QOF88_1045 [Mycobacterium sp.]|jgi:hypothetical protein|nr:hypothetical protein [Mycobacterium sp.]MDT5361666.1 hypothetical protein [Mycobacterium sp.]